MDSVTATLGAIARLPKQIDEKTREQLKSLDREMALLDTTAAGRLRTGIVAVLGIIVISFTNYEPNGPLQLFPWQ